MRAMNIFFIHNTLMKICWGKITQNHFRHFAKLFLKNKNWRKITQTNTVMQYSTNTCHYC